MKTRGKEKCKRAGNIIFCNTGGYVAAGTNLAAVHCAEERAGSSRGKDGESIGKEGGLTNHDDRTSTPRIRNSDCSPS